MKTAKALWVGIFLAFPLSVFSQPVPQAQLPNPVALVEANEGWMSDDQPQGTYAIVGGQGTASQRINLPNGIDIDVTGKIGPLNAPNRGNRLRVSNNSPHRIIIEFVLPGNTSATPINPPGSGQQGISNDLPPAGTGDVRVSNSSGGAVRVHYRLPAGKTYAVSNVAATHLWSDLNDGGTDNKRHIATNTKVTVDGYAGEFLVKEGIDLVITIEPSEVTHGYAAAASGPGSPGPGSNASPQQPPQLRQVPPRGSGRQAAPPDLIRYQPPRQTGPGWRLGVNYTEAPMGIRITNVEEDTAASNLLEPGDYIMDVTGRPVGEHNGSYYELSDILNQVADPQGWVNLRIWNVRTEKFQTNWIRLD